MEQSGARSSSAVTQVNFGEKYIELPSDEDASVVTLGDIRRAFGQAAETGILVMRDSSVGEMRPVCTLEDDIVPRIAAGGSLELVVQSTDDGTKESALVQELALLGALSEVTSGSDALSADVYRPADSLSHCGLSLHYAAAYNPWGASYAADSVPYVPSFAEPLVRSIPVCPVDGADSAAANPWGYPQHPVTV